MSFHKEENGKFKRDLGRIRSVEVVGFGLWGVRELGDAGGCGLYEATCLEMLVNLDARSSVVKRACYYFHAII